MAFTKVVGGIAAEMKCEAPNVVATNFGDLLNNESDSEDDDPFSIENDANESTVLAIKNVNKKIINKDLLENNKEVEKRSNMPVDWSEIYRTNEGTCTKEDTRKVKVTKVPTSDIAPSEYTVEDLNKFRCNHCQYVTNQKKTVTKHIRFQHRNVTKTYECPYCPYKSKFALRRHIISKHKSENEIKWFRCGQCDYKGKLKCALTKHMLTHLDPSQMIDRMKKCELCPKMFKKMANLKRHILLCHKKDKVKKLKCTDYECNSALQLKNNRDEVVGGIAAERKCEAPDVVAMKFGDLLNNESDSEDEDDPFSNEDGANEPTVLAIKNVNKKIINKDLLKNNKEVEKRSNMPVDWSEIYRTNEATCTKEDTRKVKITKVPTSYIAPSEYTVEDLNKFRCNHCRYVTNKKKAVSKHIRFQHRNVTKAYECPYCPYKAKFKLTAHIISKHKSENEIKWFRCGQCDYKGKLKSALTKHMFTHLDPSQMIDRMKKCELCPKMFKTMANLKRHILLCHKKDKVKKLKYTDCEYECNSALLLKNNRDEVVGGIAAERKCEAPDVVAMKFGDLLNNESDSEDEDDPFSNEDGANEPTVLAIKNVNKKIINKDLLKNNKEVEKRSNMPVDWSEIYRTNEATCTKEDTRKVKITKVPTSYIAPSEYTVEDINKFRCNHCQYVTNKKKAVSKHIRFQHRNVTKTYECPYCPYKAKFKLKAHIISKHKSENEIKWFRCGQCDYKGKLKSSLTKHMFTHLDPSQMIDRMRKCELCPKMFRRPYHLKRHVLSSHNKDEVKKLKCTDCEYECNLAVLLKNHRDSYHTDLENVKTLQCPKCSYKTKMSYNLDCHMSAVHKNTLQCEKCAYQTYSVSLMKLHLISHKKLKDDVDLKYRCDKCDYKTYRQYNLQVHKLNHLKPEETHFFYCYHCNFKAKRKDNLKTHVLRHFKHNEVTEQCYICDFSTTKRHILISHIDKHSKIMKDIKPEKIVTIETSVGAQINKPATSPIDKHSKGLIDVENQKTKGKKPEKIANVKTRVSARIKQLKNEKSKVGLFPW